MTRLVTARPRRRSHMILKGQDLLCQHCGAREPALPSGVLELNRKAGEFANAHWDCPKPEVLHE